MATKETRLMRGRRRGLMLLTRTIGELTTARADAGLSVVALAGEVGISKSALARLLGGQLQDVGVIQLAELASGLGYEVSLGVHPIGDLLRDKGQLAVGRRLDA